VNRKLYLVVRLRVRDLTALTAEETIQKRVAGGDRLETLDRADLWEFTFRSGECFRAKLEHLVGDSNLFVNPNKHTYRFADDYREGWRSGGWLLVVRGREDLEGAVARDTLDRRYDVAGLEEVRYGALWILRLRDEGRAEDRENAERLAVATGPKGGLLVNPHYQEYSLEPIHDPQGKVRS